MTTTQNNNKAARQAGQIGNTPSIRLDELLAAVKRVALILDESDEAQMLWEAIANAERGSK